MARAESGGKTTLYFTDVFPSLNNASDSSFFAFAPLSVTPPIKNSDSRYPPSILSNNTTKFFSQPKSDRNFTTWLLSKANQNFITWLTLTVMSSMLFDNMTEIFQELSSIFPGMNLSDIMLMFPSALRISETYKYEGDTPLTLTGDVPFTIYLDVPYHLKKYQDYLNVSLYLFNENSDFPVFKKIKNTTTPIANKPSEQQITVTLQDIHTTIMPGESLLVSMEINPGERANHTARLDKYITRWENRIDRWVNKTHAPIRQSIGQKIQEIQSEMLLLLYDSNLTLADFTDLTKTVLKDPRFLYDSVQHPTSVLFPAELPGPTEAILEYLHTDKNMTAAEAANGTGTTVPLTTSTTLWTASAFSRSKIIKNATATIYLKTPLLFFAKRCTLQASLYDNDTIIANASVTLLHLKRNNKGPIALVFPSLNYELSYGHHLRLGLTLSHAPFLASLRKISLLCDSTSRPSTLTVTDTETQNIHINYTATPASQSILPGQSIDYTLMITGKQADTVTLDITNKTDGNWSVYIPTFTTTVPANGAATLHVIVNSTNDHKSAYNNTIDLTFRVTGNTGIAKTSASATISPDAISYAVDIVGYPDALNVQKGENRSFIIVISNNNTGAIDDTDSYTITAASENHWTVDNTDKYLNLIRGSTSTPDGTKAIMIIEHVPQNTDETSDTITITTTSIRSPTTSDTITVLVKVQGSGEIQGTYDWFKTLAKNLGLTEPFGDLAPLVLITLLMVIIIFIIIIITLVLTRRVVRLTAPELLKEIDSSSHAQYEITLENTTRSPKTYTITSSQKHPATPWTVIITPQTLTIDGRQHATVSVAVHAPPATPSKDWCELDISVKAKKVRPQHLSLLTLIKDGTPILQVHHVAHTPASFIAGDRVMTSFTVANEGTVSAPNASVNFFLNRKKIATLDCAIPPGGAADIQVPWIATKGKNTVKVQVKT